ncbi:mandelate racemase/muconate lactonizing enzyme family protein [Brooklawnia cerclae]|uniref:mandelate racemase/muconate lactonizing enzyme family protein n=1 Tax=Brooklawnia cerclae TaxID=349934 RepID=UPI0031E40AC9
MKITQVEVFHVHTRTTTRQRPILLRIDTDEGIHGVGEVGLAYGVGGSAGAAIVKEYAARIIGHDPFQTERIWEDFFKHTFWGQGGGTVVFAGISGIDIALWDIKAKALGVPVYQLLGGRVNDRVRAYASQTQLGWQHPVRISLPTTEAYAQEAVRAIEDGYDAIKVDVLANAADGTRATERLTGRLSQATLRLGVERLEAIRAAVGDFVDIIVENHANTDTGSAIQFAQAIEPLDIYFYEEVNTPLNPELTRRVKEKTVIPLAGGERIYTRWGYRPFIEARSLDVIQPDIGSCGGLTEFAKIAAAAHTYDITVQAHTAGTAIAELAAVHAETAIPNFIIHEHHQKTLLDEYKELVDRDVQPVDGYFTAPEEPGLGVDFTQYVYEHSDRQVVS